MNLLQIIIKGTEAFSALLISFRYCLANRSSIWMAFYMLSFGCWLRNEKNS